MTKKPQKPDLPADVGPKGTAEGEILPGTCPSEIDLYHGRPMEDGKMVDASCLEDGPFEDSSSEGTSLAIANACGVDSEDVDAPKTWKEAFERMTDEDFTRRFFEIRPNDGETYTEKASRLGDYFMSNKIFTHKKSKGIVEKYIGKDPDGNVLNLKALEDRVRTESDILTSSADGKGGGRVVENIRRGYRSALTALGFVFHNLPTYNDKNGFNDDTALKNARILTPRDMEKMGIFNMGDPCEALRLRFLSCGAKHAATKEDEGHRLAYFVDQAATYVGNGVGERRDVPSLGRKHPYNENPEETETMNVPAPSIPLFIDCGEDKGEVREYIGAMLSMLFPDKSAGGVNGNGLLNQETGQFVDLVQEEFITTDLMALAQEHGLYGEYSQVFEDLFFYRQMQFNLRFHLFPPSPPEGREKEKKISLLNVLRDLMEKKEGDEPLTVASLGHGNGALEKFLVSLGCKVVGVDISERIDSDEVEQVEDLTLVRLSIKDKVEKAVGGRIGRVFDVFKKHIGGEGSKYGPDLAIAGDCLHETEDPGAYLRRLYDIIKKGGVLYATDPSYSQILDGVSSVSTLTLDSTRTPSELFSMESYFENIVFLTLEGAKILGISIVPGTIAGYFDPFWRNVIVLGKSENPPLYDVRGPEGVEKGAFIYNYEQIYQTVPFCLLDTVQKQELERRLGKDKIFPGPGEVKFSNLRKHIASLIYEETETLEVGINLAKTTPFKSLLPRLLRNLKITSSPSLEERNEKAGEVVGIKDLLLEMGIEINLTELDGWPVDFSSKSSNRSS